MKKMMVSPNFGQEKLDTGNIEDWIDIFGDRISNWILNQAKFLLNSPNCHYAICQLLMPYFEGITAYQKGQDSKGKSKRYFVEGFISVFQNSDWPIDFLKRVAEILYQDARCGFFHDNMFKRRIFLAKADSAINANLRKTDGRVDLSGEITAIIIDPQKLLSEVENHFKQYMEKLRDVNNKELREKFTSLWQQNYPHGSDFLEIGEF